MIDRYTPAWTGVAPVLRAFDLLDELLEDRRPHRPDLDLRADDDQVFLTALAPGLDPASIDLQVSGDELVIRAERHDQAPENARVLRKERVDYKFQRRMQLPYPVDAGQSEASYENGVLRVTLHREAASRPQRIAVKSMAQLENKGE